jgi:endonuclease YncB( thermonuclease family)
MQVRMLDWLWWQRRRRSLHISGGRMFGWRKRNDGFEWRDYVRTTILVRRKKRRDRVGEAANAAVGNLKAVGIRGAAAGAGGAKAVGRGAVNVGQQGAVLSAAGAKAVGRGAVHYGYQGAVMSAAGARLAAGKLRAAVPVAGSYLQRFGAGLIAAIAYVFAVLRTIAGIVGDYLGPALAPLGRILRQPSIRLPLLIAGAVALAGGIIRAYANGFERDTWIALLIGIGLLGALALAHAASGLPTWLSSPVAAASGSLSSATRGVAGRPLVQGTFAVIVLAFLAAGAVMTWRSASDGSVTTASLSRQERREAARAEAREADDNGDVEGRGTALSGDTLRVGGTTVRLSGIESPEPDQTCTGSDGNEWSCGQAAKQALTRLLRNGRATCSISGSADGFNSGDCKVGEQDVAAELVRGGHVFATTGLFAAYSGIEKEARAAKAGVWEGSATRPTEYRALKWEEAKRDAPDGCPIKGSVRGSRRYYTVPWARDYERVKVSPNRGERWFCSESEAQEAGFKPSRQS